MMLLGRDRAPTSGGGGGVTENFVSFDGTNDWMEGFGFSNNNNFTMAIKLRLDGLPVSNAQLLGSNFSTLKFADHTGDSELVASLLTANFSTLLNGSTAPAHKWNDNDELSILLAVDTGAGMAGGKSVVINVNGTEVLSSTTSIASPLQLTNLVLFCFRPNADPASNILTTEVCGLWMKAGNTLDPSTNYSNFFDGSNVWQAIPGSGVVNSVTPDIYIASDEVATLWNSDLDTLGNSFTMNGAVTDV